MYFYPKIHLKFYNSKYTFLRKEHFKLQNMEDIFKYEDIFEIPKYGMYK